MSLGASERSGRLVGGFRLPHHLLAPLRRAITRTAEALAMLPAASPMLPKVLGECAMLVHAAAPLCRDESLRGPAPWLPDAVDDLADRVATGTRTPETALRILLEPAHALDHASAHILLSAAGYADPGFQSHLDASAGDHGGGRPGPERLPHRELEQLWFGRLLGWPESEDVEAAVLGSSALGRPFDALSATRLDAYAFTHCTMYAHDLGTRRPALPRRVGRVLADAEAALAVAIDGADLDLAVELLMTWPLLGSALGPTATYVLGRVLETEADLGYLPGLGFDATHDEAAAVLANYHPATVMGIFAALALRAGTAIGAVPPMAAPARLDALGAAWPGQVPAWVHDVTAAPHGAGAEQLVLTAGLRTALARTDLGAVRQLLTVALELDLADGPAVRAAAGLLTRVSRGMPTG